MKALGSHLTSGVLFISSLFLLLGLYLRQSSSLEALPTVRGKNDTILFLSTANHGQINVHLATVQALVERFPSVNIHFASAPSVAKSLGRISSSGDGAGNNSAGYVTFHTLPGLQPMEVTMQRQFGPDVMRHFRHAPGAKGASQLYKIAQASLSPWTCEEFVMIYNRTLSIIDEVDPAVVVLDFAFRPAIDATRKKNRLHTFLTPTSLIDMLPMIQPRLSVLWKYPIVGTDFKFPIPWRNVPENIYVALRAIMSFENMSDLADTKKCIAKNGVDNAFDSLNSDSSSWIMQTMLEAGPTVDPIPDNVLCTSPIVSSVSPAAEQDAILVEWLRGAPTVLICLGSLFRYDQERTAIMAEAIRTLLAHTGVQVLWKFGQNEYIDEGRLLLQGYIDEGRVQIHKWLEASPVSLLETGYIVASVHHGGANCYNEALWAGVPQVVVPLWTDLFNYAQRAESIGVGVYATRGTAPEWTVEGLSSAFLVAVDGGEASVRMRRTAKFLGDLARANPGRYAAAKQIAKLARIQGWSNVTVVESL